MPARERVASSADLSRRLVGASVGAFGRRNAKEACQRDGLVPRNCNALGSRTSRGGPPGQIWARPSPRAVAASNRGLERGWSAGWGRRLQRRRGRARGCKCAPRASSPGASAPLRRPAPASGTTRSKSRRLTAPNAKSVKMWPRPHFGAAVSARLQNSQNSQKPPAGGVPGR